MKFNKIVCVDPVKLQSWAIEELQRYSVSEISFFEDSTKTISEVIKRIGDAEAIIVSWETRLTNEVIKNCTRLRYIGLACTFYGDETSNVAVDFARKNGICVKGIRDYGDPGVVEFITSELIRLLHGLGDKQWREMPVELAGRKVGILGLGTTGTMLARCLLPFGPDLFYFSRSRKEVWEKKGVKYLPLPELLRQVEIISVHLPRNTKLLQENEFQQFGKGKILINTSLGFPFEEAAFKTWLKQEGNYAIFDGDAMAGAPAHLRKTENSIFLGKSAGWSEEMQQRLSEKVVKNVKNFLA